ncbi:hypothetical protein SAMN05444166_6410 [Singulisphaera sp. GP187]|uniref:hypothetical protein n=1 Tax=Singulisphaera sp. GP187 TaxID=1882752 RepID=UPI00092AE8C6|nr:hypothetical protein [Singulisphaera sp. GP187]SIO60487.1 hypothetical protein SAMN05444166_6410 [Singulisphaera sp. GP187]
MRHLGRTLAGALALVAALSVTILAEAELAPNAPQPKAYSDPRELRLTPKPAPVPALKYRLLPMESKRTPGDAAPIYLRLGIESSIELKKGEIGQKSKDWSNLPLAQFPVAEARKYLDPWGNVFKQLKFAARRQSCRWNYTLSEQREEVIELGLSDLQEMRNWARLQAIKVRLEIAEHNYDEAVQSMETGIAFGRHVGEGPVLINTLVGVACAQLMLSGVEELIAQPDSPNLYWALTALPRPLISARNALETEALMPEWMLPELLEADRPHADAEWTPILARLHARMQSIASRVMVTDHAGVHPATSTFPELAAFKAQALPAARSFLKPQKIASDDQAILMYLAARYREIYDDQFKHAYLEFPRAVASVQAADKPVGVIKTGPFDPFVSLMPSSMAALTAEARLDRSVAALRVIEAIRMDAAVRGELPRSLDQVKVVPIPVDPMTGKPFEYHLDGETATLVGTDVEPRMVLRYQLSLRK